MTRLSLVVNPASGHGRGGRLAPRIAAHLQAAGVAASTVFTSSMGHAREACLEAVASGADGLVVVGGDGMAHVGLNACAGTGVPLGVIPAGTGNDFCRGVGLPTRWRPAIDVVAAGRTRSIDLCAVTGHLPGDAVEYVGSIVSTGFDQRVNARANAQLFDLGAPSYLWAVLAELRGFRPLTYHLDLDGERRDLDAILVAVANAGYFGGGINIAPDANLTDGLLDVVIVHPVSVGAVFKVFPRLVAGQRIDHPAIEYRRVRRAVVDGPGLHGMADGEPLGDPPLTCSVADGALTIFS